MKNFYQPQVAVIKKIERQTPEVKLFSLVFKNKKEQEKFKFNPGQFVEVGLSGFGESPFAVCSNPFLSGQMIQICVRRVGDLTAKLHTLKEGDFLTLRGPYGNGWPTNIKYQISNIKNYLFVVGGLGLIPLRSLILGKDKILGKESTIQIFYGAKTPDDFLFKNEFEKWWKNGIDLQLTIDKTCPNWDSCVGMVTTLFGKQNIVSNTLVFLCGPPIMYKFVLEKLKEHNFKDENIFISLERRMHCGIGVCQHCAIGSKYVCKDGPVFCWEEIKGISRII